MERIVLVTGGMGGLGEAICACMADAGYRVATTYSPGNTKANEWFAQMKKQGRNIFGVRCDVGDYNSSLEAIAEIQAKVGPIDILVNNAGITKDTTFKKMDKVKWDAVINTDLNSVFNMTKPVIDGMMERGWGRVINISSVNAGKGAFGQTNYSAAKAGMHGFTKSLALEVAKKGVTVNTVSPGYLSTPMVVAVPKDVMDNIILPQIPLGRLGKPEEVASLVAYLCSDDAGFVTGANFAINGGQHMS